MARTQQERRESTIAQLLDASIATISEVGYARASVAVITRRAGLSHGALFRHFDTVGDFMAATADEALRRQLDLFAKQVAELPEATPSIEGALRVLRRIMGNPTNAVIYELIMAARTDEELRRTLRAAMEEFSVKMLDTARSLPNTEQIPEEHLAAVVIMATDMFDGEAILRSVRPHADDAGERPALLAKALPVLLRALSE